MNNRIIQKLSSSRGFTLIEAITSMGLMSMAMSMVVGGMLSFRSGYFADVVRTRINGNLRSAMDIVSMNIRQTGENLQRSFPAVVLTDGGAESPDTLTLRRNMVPEVLTLCADVAAGETTLMTSSGSLSNSQCITSNVAPLHAVFEDLRSVNDGSMRIYIYDRVAKVGEFVNYTAGGTDSGQYYITVSALEHDYDQLNTGMYVIEEFHFYLDTDNDTLKLYIDGQEDQASAVAFGVTAFRVSLTMDDDSIVDELNESSTENWKQIQKIKVTLLGEENFKTGPITSSVIAEYFPRNVLSMDS